MINKIFAGGECAYGAKILNLKSKQISGILFLNLIFKFDFV